MAASTIAVFKNWWILAGSNVTVPTYFDTGNISVIGDNQVDVIGFNVTIGAQTDVDIGALNNINMLAGSTIQMSASTIAMQNYVDISGALFAPQVLGLSSINGSPFTGGGGGWVGTATSDLDMCNYNINNLTSITSAVTTMTLSNTSNIAINAPNISIGGAVNANCNAISNVGAFSRYMISTNLPQPVIQYAYVSTAAAFSGAVTITLPQRYTSVSSYIPFAVVQNDATTTFYVSTITRATFEIGWSGYTGFSDVIFSWNTMGT
jgi:hypothetical protein